jgi:hypothetical protein
MELTYISTGEGTNTRREHSSQKVRHEPRKINNSFIQELKIDISIPKYIQRITRRK